MPAKLLHHHISSIRNCQYAHKQLEISKYHDSETWQKRKNVRRNTRKKYKKKKIILYSTTATAAHTQRSLVLPFAVSARTHTQHTRWVGRVFFVAELANVLRHRFSIFQWQLIAATIHYATSVATHSIYTVISWQISLELSKASELSLYFFHNINFFFLSSSFLCTTHFSLVLRANGSRCVWKKIISEHTHKHAHTLNFVYGYEWFWRRRQRHRNSYQNCIRCFVFDPCLCVVQLDSICSRCVCMLVGMFVSGVRY